MSSEAPLPNPHLVASAKSFSHAAGVAVACIGCLVLLGWAFDLAALKTILPGFAAMKATTALAFVLAGVTLCLVGQGGAEQRRRLIARCGAVMITLIAVLTFSQDLIGWDLGIDQLLFRDSASALHGAAPGRMAPATALNFLLLGLALLLVNVETQRHYRPAEMLTLAVMVMCLLAAIGYAYGVEALYRLAAHSSVALHTAFTFILLCAGVLCARPDHGLMAVLTGNAAGSITARRLFTAAVTIPFLTGWIRLWGQQKGLYGTEMGLALFALSNILIFATLICWNAFLLNRMEAGGKRAEENLRESEERLRATFEQAAVGLAHVAPDGRWLRVNQKLCDIVGYTREELLERSFKAITHPADLDADLTYVQQILSGEIQTYSMEKRYIRKDGNYIWINLTRSLVRESSGEPKHFIAVVEDITARKDAEEALRKGHNELAGRIQERTAELQREIAERERFEQTLQEKNIELEKAMLAKDRFLASMSHELRTPLNAIIGFTGTLLMGLPGSLTADQEQQLRTVQTGARHLLSLINDLLDLAKIESGNVELHFKPVSCQSVMEEVANALRPLAESKGLTFAVKVPPQAHVIQTDRRALSQILINLINNAIKFTERGQVCLVLEQWQDNGQGLTEIRVTDTGMGVRPEDQDADHGRL